MRFLLASFVLAFQGCYSGPLSPQAGSAVTQSARTLDPSYVIIERAGTYGANLGAAAAGSTGLPEGELVVESWDERESRIQLLKEENEEKQREMDASIRELKGVK